ARHPPRSPAARAKPSSIHRRPNLRTGANMRTAIGVIAAGTLVAGALGGTGEKQASGATLIAHESALYEAIAKGDAERFRTLTLPAGFCATPSCFVPMDRLVAGGLGVFEVPHWGMENPRVV